jgi:N-methylhydantoinase A
VLEGPAIVNQYDSTTVIPPGLTARVDRFSNIVIAISAHTADLASEAAEVSA